MYIYYIYMFLIVYNKHVLVETAREATQTNNLTI